MLRMSYSKHEAISLPMEKQQLPTTGVAGARRRRCRTSPWSALCYSATSSDPFKGEATFGINGLSVTVGTSDDDWHQLLVNETVGLPMMH
jgi:hypothetical protein